MNEISIIINGVRYDAVDLGKECSCNDCAIAEVFNCHLKSGYALCEELPSLNYTFKKLTKSFER